MILYMIHSSSDFKLFISFLFVKAKAVEPETSGWLFLGSLGKLISEAGEELLVSIKDIFVFRSATVHNLLNIYVTQVFQEIILILLLT